MTTKAKRYAPEFKERAAKQVVDLRCLPPDTLARIRELERRNRELEQENALLRNSARLRSNSTGSSCYRG
jgi:transposase-like protein